MLASPRALGTTWRRAWPAGKPCRVGRGLNAAPGLGSPLGRPPSAAPSLPSLSLPTPSRLAGAGQVKYHRAPPTRRRPSPVWHIWAPNANAKGAVSKMLGRVAQDGRMRPNEAASAPSAQQIVDPVCCRSGSLLFFSRSRSLSHWVLGNGFVGFWGCHGGLFAPPSVPRRDEEGEFSLFCLGWSIGRPPLQILGTQEKEEGHDSRVSCRGTTTETPGHVGGARWERIDETCPGHSGPCSAAMGVCTKKELIG